MTVSPKPLSKRLNYLRYSSTKPTVAKTRAQIIQISHNILYDLTRFDHSRFVYQECIENCFQDMYTDWELACVSLWITGIDLPVKMILTQNSCG
jgi:hypothetical protein